MRPTRRRPRSWARLALTLAATTLLTWPGTSRAATGGPAMPWDTPLANLMENLTGPVANLLIAIAVVISGVTWAFTEHGTGGRKISQLVFGGSVALGAVAFLGALGIGGALV